MPGAAYNNSSVADSTKSGHVSYQEAYYQTQLPWYDEDGFPHPQPDAGPFYASGNTGAKISGSKVQSTSTVHVNGNPIATVGDQTTEQWQAEPQPVATRYRGSIVNVSPGYSGSGQGSVTVGSSTVSAQGKKVAYIGSTVQTHIGSNSTITTGSSNVIVR